MEPERNRLKDWAWLASVVLVCAGVGAGVIALGAWMHGRPPVVHCDDPDVEDTEMRPGDVCITETAAGEEVERRTYDEVLADDAFLGLNGNEIFGVIIIIAGCAIALLPFIGLALALREGALERRE